MKLSERIHRFFWRLRYDRPVKGTRAYSTLDALITDVEREQASERSSGNTT